MATILIDKNVMVPMCDGVRLATEVYRLQGAPPAPVLRAHPMEKREGSVRNIAGGLPRNVCDLKALFPQPGDILAWRTPEEAAVVSAKLRRA